MRSPSPATRIARVRASLRTTRSPPKTTCRSRCSILDSLKTVTREQDEDEHLSERVLDIDQALDELADEYDALRGDSSSYPTFEKLTGLA